MVKRKATQEQPQPTLRVFTYRCPPEHCQACPRQKECARCPHKGRTIKRSQHEALVEALKERMKEEEAKQLYRRRGQTVALSFADAKKHRGLRRFSGRGLRRVRIEVGRLVLAHNVLEVLAARDRKAEGRHDANPETPSS